MKILAIETATEACSAALLSSHEAQGSQSIKLRFQLAPREHTRLVLPMLDEVLSEAKTELSDVDAIAFGRGPGAFTGLRIAAGIAQGIALAADIPVIAVSTLAALAQQALKDSGSDQSVFVALDARMNEVYWAEFVNHQGILKAQGTEQVTTPEVLKASIKAKNKVLAIGNGWETYLPEPTKDITLIKNAYPSAEYIAQLALPLFLSGKSVPPEDAQPIYIRDKVAKKSKI